jgi:hypothetical protein
MKFYRIVDTEMLDTGVGAYSFYVLPEGLTSFTEMMSKFKLHLLGEPELVEVEENPKGGFLPIEGETNPYFFVGPGDGRP